MIFREVTYVPVLCRLGLHRWRCAIASEFSALLRRLGIPCELEAAHLHECRRCPKVKYVGAPPKAPSW